MCNLDLRKDFFSERDISRWTHSDTETVEACRDSEQIQELFSENSTERDVGTNTYSGDVFGRRLSS